jgi:MOSC domain-containing protein
MTSVGAGTPVWSWCGCYVRSVEGRVVRISVAPVKSLGLVHPSEVLVDRGGVVGNRRFWLVDAEGALFGGKRDGNLQRIRPEWDEQSRQLALVFPDGERADGQVELGDSVDARLYGLPRPSRRVVGPWEDAISRYVGRPLTLLWAEESAVDRTPEGGMVSLVSRASLERLRQEAGTADPIDGRRFRMLFEIDDIDAHLEDNWIGARVQIGQVIVLFNGDIGRCVVTSRNPDSGIIDLPTLVTLHHYRPHGHTEPLPFGVYGSVITPGRVRVGDPVHPIDGRSAAR